MTAPSASSRRRRAACLCLTHSAIVVDLRLGQPPLVSEVAEAVPACHGGMYRDFVTFVDQLRRVSTASSYVMSENGAASPGRWQVTQFSIEDGRDRAR